MTVTRPRVLFVYFTVTQQTPRVIEAMTDTLHKRGCDVQHARIEFTDPRYADRFSRFPFKHPYFLVAGMLLPQLRHATGQIRVPDAVREGDYDLVCIGSPTWRLNPCTPIRSFTESDLAGTVLVGKPFAAIVVCHRYCKNNLATVKALGIKTGRQIRQWYSFHRRWRVDRLNAGVDELFWIRCDQGSVCWGEDTHGKPGAALKPSAGSPKNNLEFPLVRYMST